jgi:hypothetical protein
MRLKLSAEGIHFVTVSDRLLRGLSVITYTLFCFLPLSAQKMENQSSSQISNEKQCIDNLKRIGDYIAVHLHHSAGVLGFPKSLDLIYRMSGDTKLFICPDDKETDASVKSGEFKSSYDIVNDPLKRKLSKTPHNKIAIIAEKRPNHDGKRFVLFYDGSVKAFDEAQYEELKSNSFIDSQ